MTEEAGWALATGTAGAGIPIDAGEATFGDGKPTFGTGAGALALAKDLGTGGVAFGGEVEADPADEEALPLPNGVAMEPPLLKPDEAASARNLKMLTVPANLGICVYNILAGRDIHSNKNPEAPSATRERASWRKQLSRD